MGTWGLLANPSIINNENPFLILKKIIFILYNYAENIKKITIHDQFKGNSLKIKSYITLALHFKKNLW